jgi:hypothetical protein
MDDQDPCRHPVLRVKLGTKLIKYTIARAPSFAHDMEVAEQSLQSGTAKTWEQIQKELHK